MEDNTVDFLEYIYHDRFVKPGLIAEIEKDQRGYKILLFTDPRVYKRGKTLVAIPRWEIETLTEARRYIRYLKDERVIGEWEWNQALSI